MKYLLSLSVIILLSGAGQAYAEAFSFTATSAAEPSMEGVGSGDTMVGISTQMSDGVSVFTSGRKESWKSSCKQLIAPNMGFNSRGYCVSTMEDGSELHNTMVCNMTGEGMASCWGQFVGGKGRYEGATGVVTWKNSPGKAWGGGTIETPAK